MLNLIGEYECKLDSKSRLLFPAGLKKQLPVAADYTFVLNRGFEKCLVLYPINEWKTISDEINRLNIYIKKNRDFVRYFYRGATEIVLDSTSRLLIPKGLLEYAGIDKDVVLFTFSNRIEIWEKETYQNLMHDEPEEFAALAEEVMSKKENRDNQDVS